MNLRFEHHSKPLLPMSGFVLRVFGYVGIALGIVLVFLAIGIFGYRFAVGLPWLDATLNAAMILSGMGPVDAITTQAGKVFASVYAIAAGLVFAITTGIIISPILHRVFHRLHIKSDD
jgi:hypothetical protein